MNLALPLTEQMAVQRELFLLGHRNLKSHVFGQMALPLLVAAGAWQAASHSRVLLWLATMLALAAALYLAVVGFRKAAASRAPAPATLSLWRGTNLVILSVAGTAWGGLGWLFVPEAQVNNLMVMTSFAGALAYSAASNVYDLRAFALSVVLGTATLFSQLPAAFGAQAMYVMGMCLLYLALLVLVARSAHKTLIESIQLRLSNEELARKNAEQAARAEKANRDKSEFLAAASHDLRQPVHALLLMVEAYRQSEPAAMNHPLMKQIALAGQSVNSLFNALMELSRLESGTEKPVLEHLDLPALMQEMLHNMRPEADRKGLALRMRVPRSLSPCTVLCDRMLLGRMLGNFLSNAIRYSSRGTVLLALRRAAGGRGLCLEVWDTGVGIAEQDQARIFDPYVQIGNSERDRSKGLGLGLAIVHQAASLLGMQVSLKSRPGKGSCFRLRIPPSMMGDTRPEPPATTALLTEPGDWKRLAGKRVLLVDDDDMVVQAMKALFSGWQVDLRCYTRGDPEVLGLCDEQWAPECIISDYRLPGPLNGVEVLDLVLEKHALAVGILITGELAPRIHAEAEETGYLVLSKPVLPAALASTMAALLNPRPQALAP